MTGNQDRARTAIVVGAGIGGLAAAIGLHRIGWAVTVLERAPAIAEVGAGLSLWPNAVRALDALGVGSEVRAHAEETTSRGNVRVPTGRWVRRAGPDDVRVLAMHRATLHRVLRDALPDHSLHTGSTVLSVTVDDADRATTVHESPTGHVETTADLVVAADGVNSAIRRQLWPDSAAPTFRGRTVWRGITDVTEPARPSLTLGRGLQFGLLPLPKDRAYWFLTANAEHEGIRYADNRAEVQARIRGWHDPLPAIVDATPRDRVLHNDIVDLDPLPGYVAGRVALLGDAAHAMTPDLGQGACQAIEDAAVLPACLTDDSDVPAALARYDRDRRPRTQQMAHAARQSNTRNMATGRTVHALTTLAARAMPASAWRRAATQWSDWTPPQLPAF